MEIAVSFMPKRSRATTDLCPLAGDGMLTCLATLLRRKAAVAKHVRRDTDRCFNSKYPALRSR
ncbi:hypothetical protein PUN4_180103 [Paraburkholderia unamae]|nr:hypothetical protein PUN4_180103 [Paraburkholderia unamae]